MLFFVAENSTCIERNCCSGECKAWRMDMALPGPQGMNGPMTPFLHLERPFTLTCCCINRPEVLVSEPSSANYPSGRSIGKLTDPCACCKLNTTVHAPGNWDMRIPNADLVLMADASLCQLGMCCPCPGCAIEFPVKDMKTLQHTAHITKNWTMGDCCPWCSKEWSSLDVTFGGVQDPDYKMLLTSTAIFLQMAFFDKRNND